MTVEERQTTIMVIGYGSELRGDDAAGRRVAESFDCSLTENVEFRSVHQLTPELAADLATKEAVVFVDACAVENTPGVRVRHLHAKSSHDAGAHYGDPEQLLGMALWLYGHAPNAWAIDVPAKQFEFGQPLSSLTQKSVVEAVEIINDIIKDEETGARRYA